MQLGKTVVVFLTARLDHIKVMAYIIKMCHLNRNIKRVLTLSFELRDKKKIIFVWSTKTGDERG